MRRLDDTPLDPEITAQLDAIDATLAGEPVDPQYADLAELALLLTADRPSLKPAFAAALDERVKRRFASDVPGAGASPTGRPPLGRRLLQGGWLGPMAGLAAGCVGILVAVVVIGSRGTGASSSSSSSSALTTPSRGVGSAASAAGPGTPKTAAGTTKALIAAPSRRGPVPSASQGAAGAASQGSAASSSSPTLFRAASPQPSGNGRKIVQSAQLALGTPSNHIDDVAQEVFDVAGREHAVVGSSNVTAGSNGYAEFQLSVPSPAVAATMTALSQLRYATVSSRTDATQDVNGQYLYDNRKLGDDRALRTSLLKQLAKATTQEQIDSLNARIHDAEASIRSDESTLRGLNHKIDFSQVTVTINEAAVPVAPRHSSGHSGSSFTLGKAAHDAGRVLTVAAGVALITLAALVPFVLIGALAWWIASGVRRRRREQALDLA
jgi:hypothetical protein